MPIASQVRLTLLAAATLAALTVAGCATPAPPPPPAPAPDAAAAQAAAQAASAASAAPVADPAPAPPAVPTGPVPPAQQAQAQKLAMAAVELLEAGNEDQAKSEIQNALSIDPNNKLASSLSRQISVDPVATLGRESFAYTVRSSDTLSRIAGRFLGDIYSFYLLARYNDIKVPRQVAAGQVIRIPGKAPAGGLVDPPVTRPPAPPTPPAAPAPVAVPPATPPAPPPPPKPEPVDLKKEAQRHLRDARAAGARQDLCAAIAAYGKALDADPDNNSAKLERQQATARRDKLNVTCR